MDDAEKMLNDARAANRGRPAGTVMRAFPGYGEVVVTWDRPRQRYEVGTSATVEAGGKRAKVLAPLRRLLARGAAVAAGPEGSGR
jgi:hypothetical protein